MIGRLPTRILRSPANAISLTLGVAFILLICSGCDRLPAAAVKQLRQSHDAYRHKQYSAADRYASRVITTHAASPDTAEAYYLRGLAALRQDRGGNARRDFEAGLRLSDRPELIALLHAQIGNLEFEQQHYEQAVALYRQAEHDLPSNPPSDRILLRYGISLQRTGRFRDARRVFAGVMLNYPGRPAAASAKAKAVWMEDYHSIQCGVFSTEGAARAASKRLRDGGFDASSWRETVNGKRRYVVRAGQYRMYADAKAALAGVRQQVADAFVVP